MADKIAQAPVLLIILDGWGHRAETKDNGIALARKPFFDSLINNYPHTLIDGSGPAVGLPAGIMGNSEVGHMNLGAGRVVYSGLSQIYRAIEDGGFFTNPALLTAVMHTRHHNSTLHLMGLLSDGAVHSHQDHLYALLDLAKRHALKDVAIHCFMDGRDTPPNAGVKYLRQLADRIQSVGIGRIASVSGRYFAMDRDGRWERVETAFRAICGTGAVKTSNAVAYAEQSYTSGIGDEFIVPASVVNKNGIATAIRADDAVIFFNFRADRARQIAHAFVDKHFVSFNRGKQELPGVFVAMAPYDSELKIPVAFTPQYPINTLPDVLEKNGIRQLRIAETEKFAHVTFFFNGGRDAAYAGEERVLIPSPRDVPTYDKKPAMSAMAVKDELIMRLKSGGYGVVICNFANPDMVGHTAIPEAIVKAVATVDQCLAEIVPEVLNRNGVLLITADHGNAETMKDENGEPMTAHTTNLVPFILVGSAWRGTSGACLRAGGRLGDVAPTMLELMGIEPPPEMTGKSLLRR